MAVNSTDYSDLQDAIRVDLIATIGSGGTDIIQDEAIRIYDNPVDLTPESMASWKRTNHGPAIVIAIEGMTDEDDTADGGWNHPTGTWQVLDVALYLYDETLRGVTPTNSEGTRGLSGTTNAPGIYKLINDVRATLAGYNATVFASGWEGPHFTGAAPVAQEKGKQLWKLACEYRGAVENSLDTSGLDSFVEIDADYNKSDGTDNPQVEDLISI